MMLPELLQGPGLGLRRTCVRDVPALFGIWSDAQVMRYQDFLRQTSLAQARERQAMLDESWRAGQGYGFCIVQDDLRAGPVGTLHCEPLAGGGVALGFSVARAHWGRGVATAALMLAVHAVRAACPGCELSAATHRHNAASARVLSKCGFVPCGSFVASTMLPNLDAAVPRDIDVYRRAAAG